MRIQILSTLAALVLVGYVAAAPVTARAETAAEQAEHEGHHPAQAVTPEASPSEMNAKGDMMGGMNMEHMKGMKEECMAKHKNGKMCDKKMMKKCEMKMSKNECTKMMDDAK